MDELASSSANLRGKTWVRYSYGILILNKLDYNNKFELLPSDFCKFKKLDVDVLYLCVKRECQLIPVRYREISFQLSV